MNILIVSILIGYAILALIRIVMNERKYREYLNNVKDIK